MRLLSACVVVLLGAGGLHAQEEACYWSPAQGGGIYYTSNVTAGLLDRIRVADGVTFANTQAAIDDCGTQPCLVLLPPGYGPGGPWSSVQSLPRTAAVLDVSGLGGMRVGNAPLVLRFKFDDSFTTSYGQRVAGIMLRPQYGSMTDPGLYYTAYNVVLGDLELPIPPGKKGQVAGYEANSVSDQTAADLAPGEAGHPFGATFRTRGGAPTDILDAVLVIEGQPANSYGLNPYIDKQVPGGTQYLIHPQSTGYPVTAGISLDHLNAVDGIRAGGHSVVDVSRVGVGTATPGAAVHVAAGDVAVTAGGVILRSDNGACYRLGVTGAGGLVTTAVTCP